MANYWSNNLGIWSHYTNLKMANVWQFFQKSIVRSPERREQAGHQERRRDHLLGPAPQEDRRQWSQGARLRSPLESVLLWRENLVLKAIYFNGNSRLQRDSKSDRRSRTWARWPLDHFCLRAKTHNFQYNSFRWCYLNVSLSLGKQNLSVTI